MSPRTRRINVFRDNVFALSFFCGPCCVSDFSWTLVRLSESYVLQRQYPEAKDLLCPHFGGGRLMDKRRPAHRETSQGTMLGSRATATNV